MCLKVVGVLSQERTARGEVGSPCMVMTIRFGSLAQGKGCGSGIDSG